MGVFDLVYADCPNCGRTLEFQSKTHVSSQNVFSADGVPVVVAGGVDGDVVQCQCGAQVRIRVPEVQVSMVVTVVGEPEEDPDLDSL